MRVIRSESTVLSLLTHAEEVNICTGMTDVDLFEKTPTTQVLIGLREGPCWSRKEAWVIDSPSQLGKYLRGMSTPLTHSKFFRLSRDVIGDFSEKIMETEEI